MYSALRAIFNYAEAAELIPRSPCRHIGLPSAALFERPALTLINCQRSLLGSEPTARCCGSGPC
jgi:hypothetical protein